MKANKNTIENWEKECVMTMSAFVDGVNSRMFMEHDGDGVYSDGTLKYSYIDIHNIDTRYSHVVWYNK